MFMDQIEQSIHTMQQLKDFGVRLSIDDFGTGYSSLAYLRRLAVNTLKIDRSFIGELHDSQGLAIVEAVIGLARSLGMDVVAEGVETPAQLEVLRERGCHLIQGYLFARPMSRQALLHLLAGGPAMLPQRGAVRPD